MIYLFHGFGGSIATSETIQTLLANIQSNNGIGICPIDYSSTDPNSAYFTIDNIVKQDNDEKIFIGVSLGGFWARYFANQYPNSKLIMINPALDAPFELSRFVGEQLAGVTVTDEMIEALDPYTRYTDHNNLSISLLVGSDDEVIPHSNAATTYANRGNVMITPGKHRLELTSDHIDFINTAINNIAG